MNRCRIKRWAITLRADGIYYQTLSDRDIADRPQKAMLFLWCHDGPSRGVMKGGPQLEELTQIEEQLPEHLAPITLD